MAWLQLEWTIGFQMVTLQTRKLNGVQISGSGFTMLIECVVFMLKLCYCGWLGQVPKPWLQAHNDLTPHSFVSPAPFARAQGFFGSYSSYQNFNSQIFVLILIQHILALLCC
jgi:hypothetical protein